jgi:hypothetical protein
MLSQGADFCLEGRRVEKNPDGTDLDIMTCQDTI